MKIRDRMDLLTNWGDKSAAVALAHEIGMSAEEFTTHGDAIVAAFLRHRYSECQRCVDIAERYEPQHELNATIAKQVSQNIAKAMESIA